MPSDINSLIEKKQYDQALKIIDEKLSSSDMNEDVRCQLLQQRITVKTHLGEKDEYVADLVKKEKHPSKLEYSFAGDHIIILQLNNQFITSCDAYVNLVPPKKFFEDSKGSRQEFVNRLGIKEIRKQLTDFKNLREGDFATLSHPALSAPKSYHILFDHDEHEDKTKLSKGIKKVLDDAIKNNYKVLSFFPLGYGTVMRASDKDREKIKSEIVASSIEPIVEYFFNNARKNIPIISFNFINADTMYAYNKVVTYLFNMKIMAKTYLHQKKTLTKREENLLDATKTLDSKYVKTIKEMANFTLDYDDNVLLTGETGVGKSFLAKIIHDNSRRSGKPFEKLNCGLLRPNWIYVELFGARKGAYTDCKEDREGAIYRAEGGTLFIDEIGHADFDTQKMLLQFLDDGTYRRLGDDKIKDLRKSDVRVILGTNRELDEKISQNEFLPDLYERIMQGYQFVIPPLRKRQDDIVHFAEYIIDRLNNEKNCSLRISEKAKELLKTYKWPGNIRQLKWYVEYLHTKTILLKENEINETIILNKPPRDYLYKKPSYFESLESSLRHFIRKWDIGNDGKMNKDLCEPILAKIYIDDLKFSKTNAINIIGIDGTGGKRGPLMQRYAKYNEVRSKFSNNN